MFRFKFRFEFGFRTQGFGFRRATLLCALGWEQQVAGVDVDAKNEQVVTACRPPPFAFITEPLPSTLWVAVRRS